MRPFHGTSQRLASVGLSVALLALTWPTQVIAQGPSPCPADEIVVADGCASPGSVVERIGALVETAMRDHRLKAAIAGVALDGETLMTDAWGESMTGVPATPDMHFRNGAIAIAYMGIVLLQLQEQGVLDLDDTLSTWFPELPRADEITLRMLMNGTSGYADYVDMAILPLHENPFRSYRPEELIALGLGKPMVCHPGRCWSYAHTNFVILGQVMEAASGRPLADLIREGVLEPLSLANTQSEQTALIPEPVLHAFDAERGIYEESTFWDPRGPLRRER